METQNIGMMPISLGTRCFDNATPKTKVLRSQYSTLRSPQLAGGNLLWSSLAGCLRQASFVADSLLIANIARSPPPSLVAVAQAKG